MKTFKKYSGFFFIPLNIIVLTYTAYVYYLFNRNNFTGFAENHGRLWYYMKEKGSLIELLFLLLFVAEFLLIKQKWQKIFAIGIIVIAFIIFSITNAYAYP